MRLLVPLLFVLTFKGYAQSPLEVYVKSEFYSEHLKETYQVYQELMDGKIGPTLTLLIEDSVWGEENRLYIDSVLNSPGFKLAEIVDTMPTPGTAFTLTNIGTAYFGKEEFPTAIRHFENVLTIFTKSFDEQHPNVIQHKSLA